MVNPERDIDNMRRILSFSAAFIGRTVAMRYGGKAGEKFVRFQAPVGMHPLAKRA